MPGKRGPSETHQLFFSLGWWYWHIIFPKWPCIKSICTVFMRGSQFLLALLTSYGIWGLLLLPPHTLRFQLIHFSCSSLKLTYHLANINCICTVFMRRSQFSSTLLTSYGTCLIARQKGPLTLCSLDGHMIWSISTVYALYLWEKSICILPIDPSCNIYRGNVLGSHFECMHPDIYIVSLFYPALTALPHTIIKSWSTASTILSVYAHWLQTHRLRP